MPISNALQYLRHGDPNQVLKLVEKTVADSPGIGEVLVRWISAPVHPIDIGRISGRYPGLCDPPCIGGSEGLGVIEQVGSGVNSVKTGDHVIPLSIKHPTWTNYAIVRADEVRSINKKIKIEFASTMLIDPPTAYRLLKDFAQLERGDYIIQNCANSAVGQLVVQLAREWGFKTINLVRDRAGINHAMEMLKKLGADVVLTEKQFESKQKELASSVDGPVKLALNCCGGHSALLVTSALTPGGYSVTYGEMSGKCPEFPTGSFIFKDIKAVGFSISNCYDHKENSGKCDEMFRELQELHMSQRLLPPELEKWGVQDFTHAIPKALEGAHPKQLLIMDTVL